MEKIQKSGPIFVKKMTVFPIIAQHLKKLKKKLRDIVFNRILKHKEIYRMDENMDYWLKENGSLHGKV